MFHENSAGFTNMAGELNVCSVSVLWGAGFKFSFARAFLIISISDAV